MKELLTEGFHSEQEYYRAVLEAVRNILRLYSRDRLRMSESGVLQRPGGMVVDREELELLLEGRQSGDGTETFIREELQKLRIVRGKGRNAIRNGVIISMEYLFHAFGLSESEVYMVMFSWAAEADHDLGTLFCLLNERSGIRVPTMELCIQICAASMEERLKLRQQCMERWETLSFLFAGMYEESRRQGQSCSDGFMELGLKLDHRIASYLQDYTSRDRVLEEIVRYDYEEKGEILIHQKISEGLDRLMDTMERPGGVFLYGERGAGKKFQLSGLCRRMGKGMLLVDAGRLFMDVGKLSFLLFRIFRESLLRGNAMICFCDIPGGEEPDLASRELMEAILWGTRFWNTDIFFTSNYMWNGKTEEFGRSIHKIRMPETTTEERYLLWKTFLGEDGIPENMNMEFLADKYILSAGSIKSSVEDYRNGLLREGGSPSVRRLMEACRKQLDHRLGRDAVCIPAKYRWEDLILPSDQKKMLRDACDQVMYHHQVYHRWGFEKKLAYGRSVSMIFYGPPGTGKTMGAQVIANELDLELYKVDMAGVMSKYVGESEKKLGNIFEQAKKSQSILFFDEADVLFGKRTDQKDSNDKYANASTAYLLQKIEEYEGIIILATNLLQNFDNAFLRRFKFIIEFPFTDKERRLQIWEKVFPADTPREELDLEYLAEEFKFSGSQIKNAAVAAAFLAAGEKKEVGMRHLLTAVKREMAKTGKTLIAKDFGPYYYLMEREET